MRPSLFLTRHSWGNAARAHQPGCLNRNHVHSGHGWPNPGAVTNEGDVATIPRIGAPGRCSRALSRRRPESSRKEHILNGIPGQGIEVR